jgi:hypothetical protein
MNLSYLPDDLAKVSGFGEKDTGVLELEMVSHTDAQPCLS